MHSITLSLYIIETLNEDFFPTKCGCIAFERRVPPLSVTYGVFRKNELGHDNAHPYPIAMGISYQLRWQI